MPLAAAIVGAAVIGGGASIIAANKASSTARRAADQNIALANDTRNRNEALMQPTFGRGEAAGGTINALLGLGGDRAAADAAFDTFKGSTGYDFRVNEGNRALNAGFAGRGMLQSGAAMREFGRFGQGIASDEFSRYLGQLGGQRDAGINAMNGLVAGNNNTAGFIAGERNNAAAATGNAALATASSINNLLSTGVNAFGFSKGSSYLPKTGGRI